MPRTRSRRQPEPAPEEPQPQPEPEPQALERRRRNLRENPTANLDQELEDKSLHLVGGCYGTWDSKAGFNGLTNFRMEPAGFISSKKFILKGNLARFDFLPFIMTF